MIKKKVFGGVPYVIIEPSETWNSEYYSILFDEEGFYSWYDNYIADNTAIYEIYNVLTIQTDEGNGFYIDIRVLKPQPSPGPLATVAGTEVSTDPLDLIDIKCVFATNEESILSYALHLWETTKHVIYTEPPERYPIREGSGYESAIMGHYRNQADGDYSVAEGLDTNASGERSHAEGSYTTASGFVSHAEGSYANANGNHSHAEGYHTTTFGESEHAEGMYNKSYDSTSASVRVIHSVGIGSSDDDRKNAHEIKFNGDHYVYGVGGYDGTNATADTTQTLQEVIQSLLGITIDTNQTTTGYTNGDQYYNIYDLSSLNYVPGCAIIFQSENSSNNSIRLKFIYAYDESGLAETIQFTESDSMTYDSFTLLSPLITNMGVDQLTVFHGKINSENEFKYYLVIQTTVDPEPTNS